MDSWTTVALLATDCTAAQNRLSGRPSIDTIALRKVFDMSDQFDRFHLFDQFCKGKFAFRFVHVTFGYTKAVKKLQTHHRHKDGKTLSDNRHKVETPYGGVAFAVVNLKMKAGSSRQKHFVEDQKII